MKLTQALRLFPTSGDDSPAIAFVGAGGKTTAMFQLARELSPPVIVTGTTHFGAWQTSLADEHIIAASTTGLKTLSPRGVTLVTGLIVGDRTQGLDGDTILWLHEMCRTNNIPLLIEADGSRQTPLKAPADHEPPLPAFVNLVVHVSGLSGLGSTVEETVFRPEIFARLCGLKPREKVTLEALARVLTHPEGGLKNIPTTARRVALLNQADTLELQAVARDLSGMIKPKFDAVLTTSLIEGNVFAAFEPIAGIVLAAGGSTRLGQPKQLLDWRGEPFIRAIVKIALNAALWPVVVVTGAHAADVETALEGLDVVIARNERWQEGQAGSIRLALASLFPNEGEVGHKGTGAVVFLLADQPQVTPTFLRALAEEHARTLAPVIAPIVMDSRANPVLFDRVTFPDLMRLSGDVGGRGVFGRHRVHYLPWHDDALLLDVDTPEDYRRLKKLLE